jgi:hypothetical protein
LLVAVLFPAALQAQTTAHPRSRVPVAPGPKAVSRTPAPPAAPARPPVDSYALGYEAGYAAGWYGPAYLYWAYGVAGYAMQPGGYVQQAPPALRPEVAGPAPGPAMAWVPGFWNWVGTWTWVSGQWVAIPGGYHRWMPGRWASNEHGWYWVPGRWE